MSSILYSPSKILRPIARSLLQYGEFLEAEGRKLIPETLKSYYPSKAYLLLHEEETTKALNTEQMRKLGLTPPQSNFSLTALNKSLPPTTLSTLSESVFVALNASIGAGVKVSKNCSIWYSAELGDNTLLGKNCHILDRVVLGKNVTLADNVTLLPGVVVEDGVSIPEGVFVEAGTTITNKTPLTKGAVILAASPLKSNETQIDIANDDSAQTRQEAVIQSILAAIPDHKRESERTLSEQLELREDIKCGYYELEDVIELGTYERLRQEREAEEKRDKYALEVPDESVILTKEKQ